MNERIYTDVWTRRHVKIEKKGKIKKKILNKKCQGHKNITKNI